MDSSCLLEASHRGAISLAGEAELHRGRPALRLAFWRRQKTGMPKLCHQVTPHTLTCGLFQLQGLSRLWHYEFTATSPEGLFLCTFAREWG